LAIRYSSSASPFPVDVPELMKAKAPALHRPRMRAAAPAARGSRRLDLIVIAIFSRKRGKRA